MKLVIAEKPSVAQSIAAVLGATKKHNGFLDGNGWVVSWCIGHLARLADADFYNPRYASWALDDLPIIPDEWHLHVPKEKQKQFDILAQLMNDPKIDTIVNACDAGREGELIFRSVYNLAECGKTVQRLWISSMEDSAIRSGFADLHPGSDYDSLYEAAQCRAKADWLVGINASRLFSLLYNHRLNIGRVMSPTLSLIVQRESEIAGFEPQCFYKTVLDFGGFSAESERFDDRATADQVQSGAGSHVATIINIERKIKKEHAPALYDLTSLQREANRTLGYTAQQTLDYLQNLYEKKLCTYPRTDSRYLTDDEAEIIPLLVDISSTVCSINIPTISNIQQIINNRKVSDHHAIIPTKGMNRLDLASLPNGERAILCMIAKRLLCAVCRTYEYEEVTVTIRCDRYNFTAKGKTVLIEGWKALDSDMEPGKFLPSNLQEGQEIPVLSSSVKEGQTTPPKHYTEDTILSSMETAGVQDMPEDAERKGLGTPATRAGILEKLVSTGLIERKKSKKSVHLIPSRDAISLITVLPEQLQSPLLTADWEYRLKEIENHSCTAQEFMGEIREMIEGLIRTYKVIPGTENLFSPPYEVIGKCPRCGGNIIEKPQGFFCQNHNCAFSIWKNNRWWAMKKKAPSRKNVTKLLSEGRTFVTDLYSERTGKRYDAIVALTDDGRQVSFHLEFPKGGKR